MSVDAASRARLGEIPLHRVQAEIDRPAAIADLGEVTVAAADVEHRSLELEAAHPLALDRAQNRPMRRHLLELLCQKIGHRRRLYTGPLSPPRRRAVLEKRERIR